jgi:hypothetical protein
MTSALKQQLMFFKKNDVHPVAAAIAFNTAQELRSHQGYKSDFFSKGRKGYFS